jgi:hypothetical protein
MRNDTTGLTVLGGVGVERFASGVNDAVGPGFTWGVTVLGRPNQQLGLELGYNGAVNGVRGMASGAVDAGGVDILRNGAHVAASLGPAWRIQPYVLGGFGVNRFSVRGTGGDAMGLRSDTAAAIPVAGGVRTNLGPIAADLRLDYNIGLGEGFAGNLTDSQNLGRYRGVLQVGGQF